MPDDPRERRTPKSGVSIPRAVTERGGADSARDRFKPKIPPERVQEELGHTITSRHRLPPPFEEEEATPVTMIKIVRAELKDDVAAVDKKVDALGDRVRAVDTGMHSVQRGMAQLTGEVSATNKLLPQMVDMIKDELKVKRTIDAHMAITSIDVAQHQEITKIDDVADAKKVARKAKLRLVSLVTSTSLITAILTLIATKC